MCPFAKPPIRFFTVEIKTTARTNNMNTETGSRGCSVAFWTSNSIYHFYPTEEYEDQAKPKY